MGGVGPATARGVARLVWSTVAMALSPKTVRNLRVAATAAVVGITLYWVKPGSVLQRMEGLQLQWLALGTLLCGATYGVIALRWRYLANAIGAPLSYRRALSEYVLGGFFNQALPTGLAGPVLRALRHSKAPGLDGGPVGISKAVTAVVLDRLLGLVGQAMAALLGGIVLSLSYPWIGLWGVVAALATLGACGLGYRVACRRYASFSQDLQGVLQERSAIAWHTLGACFAVVLLSFAFYCASLAMGLEFAYWRVLCVAPLILGAMVIPLSVAGWGIREAAAAALFSSMGTDAATGVAVSVTFGLMSLLSTLPGLVIWVFSYRGGVVSDST